MNKLENVGIICNTHEECVEACMFLVENGISNPMKYMGKCTTVAVYWVFANQIKCNSISDPKLNTVNKMSLQQAKELVNSKPELTFPRKMLVWNGNITQAIERTAIAFDSKNNIIALFQGQENDYNKGIVCDIRQYIHYKELPTQQKINQEKIEELEKQIEILDEQERAIQKQIYELKSQNCE